MTLTSLEIFRLRNISHASLTLAPGLNLLVGPNGSGKTSVLESAYFLSTARSHRNSTVNPIIQRGEADCLVTGQVSRHGHHYQLGVQRYRDRGGSREIRINGETIKKSSDLVRLLPTLYLGPESVDLLLGSPAERRRFLNWGVFHVKHDFAETWETATRTLAQRNHLLQQQVRGKDLEVWTRQLAESAEAVHLARQNYVETYLPVFQQVASQVADLDDLQFRYARGWEEGLPLLEQYEQGTESDLKVGYTQRGFQRADVRIDLKGQPAAKVCSRGELKSIVWALLLAQGAMAKMTEQQGTLYLVDDMASEFDAQRRRRVCSYLNAMDEQVVMTGVDQAVLEAGVGEAPRKVFYMEAGQVHEG